MVKAISMSNSQLNLSWKSVIFHNRTPFELEVIGYLPEFLQAPIPGNQDEEQGIKYPQQKIRACDTFIWGIKSLGEVTFKIKLLSSEESKEYQVDFILSQDCKNYQVIITEENAVYWDVRKRLGPDDPTGIKKVHVGCGPKNIFPDWWNVDIRSFQGIDTVMDVTHTWPFQDIDFVYGEHFLEHLPLDGAINFLVSSGNSLKLGGKIRLTTPNLAWVVDSHFPVNDAPTHAKVDGTFAINRAFHGWGHQFLYSQEFLEYLLSQLGYEQIVFFEYGKSDTLALTYLERHGKYKKYNNFSNLIIVEATRGAGEIIVTEQLAKQIEVMFMRYYLGGH